MSSAWWVSKAGRATRLPERARRMPDEVVAMELANEVGAPIGYRPRPVPLQPLPMTERWVPDPTHRHELRLHDGAIYTDQVMDVGVRSVDPYQ
ncbi:MAG: hypothetical protein ABMA25_25620 [Ilumatobacteraceae bacterium]